MTLIFSESNDYSTNNVIDWLIFNFKVRFKRINTNNTTSLLLNTFSNDFNCNTFNIEIENQSINNHTIKSIWYRRGSLKLFKQNLLLENDIQIKINDIINYENRSLSTFINYLLQPMVNIGNPFTQDINKLYMLDIAQKVGLSVPVTTIVSKKEYLINFKNQYDKIICKTIGAALNFIDVNSTFMGYTNLINDDDISSFPNQFSPSLFQVCIEKQYEIRIFYLKGLFYSMAIFSQNDEQTKIDFRNYNTLKPNRRVPYKLPKSIEKKIDKLMRILQLNDGSIDMIVDKNGNYLFLEVNPVGQFGMVSIPCNYQIEKKIAETLSKN